MTQTFTLEYWEDDGWLVGRLRGVPGVFSQGETLDKLQENIREAYELMTEDEEPPPENVNTKHLNIELAV